MSDLDQIILSITDEIISLKDYQKNLKKFTFSQTVSGKMIWLDFSRAMDEIARITKEIQELEARRVEIYKLNDAFLK